MSASTHVQRAAALVVAGIILYVPANVLPVMTMTVAGDIEPLTILGGVQELYDSGLAPIAGIVFLASIVVPFVKLFSMSWLLLMHGQPKWRRARTTVLRVLHRVGVWSMIDLFLLSILVAVGQLGILASVQAEPGALFFAAVLVLTLVATEIYEPRFIWQNAPPTPPDHAHGKSPA
jgi:paraquat-inducible protein A